MPIAGLSTGYPPYAPTNSGSLATLMAMRRASSRVSRLAATRRSGKRLRIRAASYLGRASAAGWLLDARPMLDGRDKDFSRLVEAVASVQQGIDTHAVPAPRFDIVEVAVVCIERVVSLFG